MAKRLDPVRLDFHRVIVSYQRVTYPNFDRNNPQYGPILTETLGPYEKVSTARGAAASFVRWRHRLVERRVQKLVAVGTITTVVDENGNEEKKLGAHLEWRDV